MGPASLLHLFVHTLYRMNFPSDCPSKLYHSYGTLVWFCAVFSKSRFFHKRTRPKLTSLQSMFLLHHCLCYHLIVVPSISHELRTPLHGVMASCDLLGETALSDTQESFLSTAKQCASVSHNTVLIDYAAYACNQSLTETINHVLDFTKSTSQSVGQKRTASVLFVHSLPLF